MFKNAGAHLGLTVKFLLHPFSTRLTVEGETFSSFAISFKVIFVLICLGIRFLYKLWLIFVKKSSGKTKKEPFFLNNTEIEPFFC